MSNTHTGQVLGNTTLTTTTETVVCVIAGFVTNNPQGTGVALDGMVDVSTGTGVTALVGKLYRAGATAPVVGNAPPGGATQVGNSITAAASASSTAVLPLDEEDTSATALNSGGVPLTYFATVTQTGATGNGAVSLAVLNANSATGPE